MVTASSPAVAVVLAAVGAEDIDVALLDMNYARDTTSGGEGLDLLTRVRAADPALPVVLMTAWGSVAGAVEAMKRGAKDYVEKPWQNDRLLTILRMQIELRTAHKQAERLREQAQRDRDRALPDLVSVSKAMAAVKKLMERVAGSDANVLVTGEHGTGKDVVARWIHAASGRAGKSFVPVNAGALADGVFESELFGHVKGAFTDAKSDRIGCFEMADGGTLFLDEIGTMPVGQQAKLLRVLQSGEFSPVGSSRTRRADVRTSWRRPTSTSPRRSRAGRVPRGPALSLEHRRDSSAAAPRAARRRGSAGDAFSGAQSGALQKAGGRVLRRRPRRSLAQHTWPGNVRELEHVIERAVVLAEGNAVEAADLNLRRAGGENSGAAIERMSARAGRGVSDPEGARAGRRQRDRRGGGARAVAERASYRRLSSLGIKEPP